MQLTETLLINDVEYVFTISREIVISIEKYSKAYSKMGELSKLQKDLFDEINITDETNPLDGINELYEKSKEISTTFNDIMIKGFWVLLYAKHQFSITKVREEIYPLLVEYFNDLTDENGNKLDGNAEIGKFYGGLLAKVQEIQLNENQEIELKNKIAQ